MAQRGGLGAPPIPMLRRRRRGAPRPALLGAATCRSATRARRGRASHSGTSHRVRISSSQAWPSLSNAF
eukprot:3811484-Alexandrium_andersonii.AAC.1